MSKTKVFNGSSFLKEIEDGSSVMTSGLVDVSETDFFKLFDILKINKTLSALGLYGGRLSDTITKSTIYPLLCCYYTSNSTTTKIKLISDILRINNTITSLDLYWTEIGKDGIGYLSEALKINKTITILKLNGTKIDDEGVKYLAAALSTNQTIESLALRSNKIHQPGIKYLSKALETNTTLTSLDLSYNDLGSMKPLEKLLEINITLSSVECLTKQLHTELVIDNSFFTQRHDRVHWKPYSFEQQLERNKLLMLSKKLAVAEKYFTSFIPKVIIDLISSYLISEKQAITEKPVTKIDSPVLSVSPEFTDEDSTVTLLGDEEFSCL